MVATGLTIVKSSRSTHCGSLYCLQGTSQEGLVLKYTIKVSWVSHFPHKDDLNATELCNGKVLAWESGFNFVQRHFLGNLISLGLDFLWYKMTKLC